MTALTTPRSVRRLLATSILVAIATVAAATPTMAGGQKIWVDDDGLAGSNGCWSSQSAYSTIQSAIDASGTDDSILVCPGTYQEELSVRGARDGLTIRSTWPLAAVVLSPTVMTSSTLVEIRGVTDVTIERLSLEALTTAPCTSVDRMVAITNGSRRTVVRDSRIHARPSDPSGACGYGVGIVLHTNSSVRVTDSRIRDFREYGIRLDGSTTSGTIVRNSIMVDSPGLFGDPSRYAVYVDGGRAIVAGNNVAGGVEMAPGGGHQLATAIAITNGSTSIVRDNRIRRANFGIAINSASGAIVRDNDLRHGVFGITASASSNDRIVRNRVRDYEEGIHMASTTAGNVLRSNDVRGNSSIDCVDDSSGGGTAGTANTWIDNLGFTDDPDGLCTPTAP